MLRQEGFEDDLKASERRSRFLRGTRSALSVAQAGYSESPKYLPGQQICLLIVQLC